MTTKFEPADRDLNKELRSALREGNVPDAVMNNACNIATGMVSHAASMVGLESGGRKFTKGNFKKVVTDAEGFVTRTALSDTKLWSSYQSGGLPWCNAFQEVSSVVPARRRKVIPPIPEIAGRAMGSVIGAFLMDEGLTKDEKKEMIKCLEKVVEGKRLSSDCEDAIEAVEVFSAFGKMATGLPVTTEQAAVKFIEMLR